MSTSEAAAFAPGRVNLIGDHTDYTGGRALPMAIQLGTTVRGSRHDDEVRLTSALDPMPAVVALGIGAAALTSVEPAWARYVAGVVHELQPTRGLVGQVATTLPVGGGLSSSAALELALALALGFDGSPRQLAELGQRAEQAASGVPCGIMDQLASAEGAPGHALLVDFTTMAVEPVPVPDDLEVVVVDSGQPRRLADSAYASRRADCERAAVVVGPLLDAAVVDLDAIDDPVIRRRAHHVVTENERVLDFADALRCDDRAEAGALMLASHRSLRDEFEVSTSALDALVDELVGRAGVYGARLTGAGFGGCVVALTEPGALPEGLVVRASGGARRLA